MRTVAGGLLACVAAGLLLAGGFSLEVTRAQGNAEAKRLGAVLVARVASCHAPAKTTLTATAEGVVDGRRRSIPLQVVALASPGEFAVLRAWAAEGAWAVRLTAANPDYVGVAPSAVLRVDGDNLALDRVKHFFHAPTEAELNEVLSDNTVARK